MQVAEEGIKRRKVEGSQETPGPPGQGTGTVCAGSSVATQPGAQGPMRSSALGQALLRVRGASVSDSMRGSVLAASFAGAGSHLAEVSPVLVAQLSVLGEAAGAESRVRLKRSRELEGPGPVLVELKLFDHYAETHNLRFSPLVFWMMIHLKRTFGQSYERPTIIKMTLELYYLTRNLQ